MTEKRIAGLGLLERWRQWTEPWYYAYALLGATTGGLTAIFLPLGIDRNGSAAHVGLVMAIVGVGQLTAGVWGTLADKYRLHRAIFVGGSAAAALTFLGFAAGPSLVGWAALALVLGFGTAAANTVANLFIVEAYPKPEWDERIGWLQAVYNAGVVGGLALASVLTRFPLRTDFLVGAALTAGAVALGWFTTHTPPRAAGPKPAHVSAGPAPWWSTNSPRRVADYPSLRTLRRLVEDLRSPFGLFVVVWLVANFGLSAVNGLYPLMMQNLFGVQPRGSSALMSVATGVSILLYAPSSALTKRMGGPRVFQAALLGRTVALAALAALGVASIGGVGWLAAAAFAAVLLAGPLFSVSGTIMASNLATTDEGEAMGAYNTSGSMGALIGAALGGWAASVWGYEAAPVLGLIGVGGGLLLSLLLSRARGTRTAAPSATAGPAPR